MYLNALTAFLVSFSGVSYTFETSFVYKEHLPNDTDYIILGQRVCTLLEMVLMGNCPASH
jgi:hypothetical protein